MCSLWHECTIENCIRLDRLRNEWRLSKTNLFISFHYEFYFVFVFNSDINEWSKFEPPNRLHGGHLNRIGGSTIPSPRAVQGFVIQKPLRQFQSDLRWFVLPKDDRMHSEKRLKNKKKQDDVSIHLKQCWKESHTLKFLVSCSSLTKSSKNHQRKVHFFVLHLKEKVKKQMSTLSTLFIFLTHTK